MRLPDSQAAEASMPSERRKRGRGASGTSEAKKTIHRKLGERVFGAQMFALPCRCLSDGKGISGDAVLRVQAPI